MDEDYDDGQRFDEMECARGDYNVHEEEQVFQDHEERDPEFEGHFPEGDCFGCDGGEMGE